METLDRMPFAAQDAVWARLAEIADKSFMNKKLREQYDESCKILWDNYSADMSSWKRGKMDREAEMVSKMKAQGLSLDTIMEISDLTAEQINAIK